MVVLRINRPAAQFGIYDYINFYQSRLAFQAKHMGFVNLDSDLRRLADLVANTSKVKSDVSYASVSNVDVVTI